MHENAVPIFVHILNASTNAAKSNVI